MKNRSVCDTDTSRMTLEQAYNLLAVNGETDLGVIKQSFRSAAKLYHPDAQSGLADTDMFQSIVTAYDTIIADKRTRAEKRRPFSKTMGGGKTAKSGVKKGWWNSVRKAAGPKIHTVFNGYKASEKSGNQQERNNTQKHPSLLTFSELMIRFDKSPNIWVRMEAMHTMYHRFRARFEPFAIRRLPTVTDKTKVELIRVLGRIKTQAALNAIARYITSRDRSLCCAAFIALDSAGEPGKAIIDEKLNTPSALGYHLRSVVKGTKLEKQLLQTNSISPRKLRRLSVLMRKTGLPLPDLLEGIGVSLPS